MEAHNEVTGDMADRRGFLAGSLVGGALLIGGTAACSRTGEATADSAAAAELTALKAQYADPQKAPIEHVAGPRMGLEILNRLEYSKSQVRNDAKLVAEIDSIMEAIRKGDRLVKSNDIACW